jgi:26S proteasome regulatory subunit N13
MTATTQQTQQEQIANILAHLSQQTEGQQEADYTLPDLLAPISSVLPLAADPAVQEALRPYLPPGVEPTAENLQRVLTSVELKKSFASFDHAIRTGALGPLVASLGLSESAALGVEEFLKAVQEKADGERGSEMQTD